MSTVTAFEAKTRFGELLDRVAKGEEIIITRHEKPVARIVPEGTPSLQEVKKTVATIRHLREQIKKQNAGKLFSQKDIKSWIAEGRQ